ncbi:MAG: aldehyde dehydrogenase [Halothece sp.]
MVLTQVNAKELVRKQREFFETGQTKDIDFRRNQLQQLKQVITENKEAIVEAIGKDIGKPAFETLLSEFYYCTEEIEYALKHLNNWTKPQRVKTPLTQLPAASKILAEPLGVVLIISPWNYPLQLTIMPLIGAIAAGNCAILKPSEISPATSHVIADLIAQAFSPEYITVVEGEKDVSQELLEQKFNHIFFTGSTRVGRIVMEAAAKQLTPVTLELGGKCPCIVDTDIKLKYAIRRILWGKFSNAGQSCIAPDYILIPPSLKPDFLAAAQDCLQEFYGKNPAESPDYGRIINDKHFKRLSNLLSTGEVIVGGETKAEERYIAPTIMDNVSWEDPIMEDEIFGPILPIVEYQNLENAIAHINSRPKPLALYIFSRNDKLIKKVLQDTTSGGVCINDTIMHLAPKELPFGGVGSSGIGRYHGKASFDTFSNQKSILHRSFLFDLPVRYPPYSEKFKFLKWLV